MPALYNCVMKQPRYTCTCDPDKVGKEGHRSEYIEKRQVVVPLADWIIRIRRRLTGDYSTAVCIDSCIVDDIKKLWYRGIETTGSCCGHGKERAWVRIHPAFFDEMVFFGYERRLTDEDDDDVAKDYTFYL